jgi:hypothetical protein
MVIPSFAFDYGNLTLDTTSSVVSTLSTKVTKKNQDATAYCGTKGSLTHSEKTPKAGMCAVHFNSSTNKPYISFGTKLTLSSKININGTKYSTLTVEDTGDYNFKWSNYWIDVCFGTYSSKSDSTYTNALAFGEQTVTYSYYT